MENTTSKNTEENKKDEKKKENSRPKSYRIYELERETVQEGLNNQKVLDESKKILECKMDQVIEINNELQKRIEGFEEEKLKLIDAKDLESQQALDDLKNKVLKFIKNSNKNSSEINMKNMDLATRLGVLHTNQLLCELEFQSLQIEDLLKQREQLDKIILEQKNDIKIHKEVERILTEKNKKYTDMIKVLSNKIDELNSNTGTFNRTKFSTDSEALSDIRDPDRTHYSLCPHCGCSLNYDPKKGNTVVALQNELIARQKEIESLKMKYDTANSKLNYIEKKYSNIFALFENVLEKSYEDPKFQKYKEIYINLDEYKNCDFLNLPSEDKYSLALMLMKYIVPLVNSEMSKSQSFNNSCKKVRTKYFFRKEESTNTYSSFNDTTSMKSSSFYCGKRKTNFNSLKNSTIEANRSFLQSNSSFGKFGRNNSTGKMLGLPSLRGTEYSKDNEPRKMYSILKA